MNRPEESKNDNENIARLEIRILEIFARLIVPERVREEFLGDLLEEWSSSIVPRSGRLKAFGWLCSQLLRSQIPMIRIQFQKQNVPKPVKMAAAANLLFAIFHFFSFVYFVSTMPIAWFGLVKMLIAIAAAIGLLNLRPGWRTFTVFISWLGVLIIPFYILATIFSTDFMLYIFEMSGIDSPIILLSMAVFGFAMFLFMLICLTRPDVKKAFQSGKPQSTEQATLAS